MVDGDVNVNNTYVTFYTGSMSAPSRDISVFGERQIYYGIHFES